MNIDKVNICGVDTKTLPRLSKSESQILLEKIKRGDGYAKSQFVTANVRLVLSIIKRFHGAKVSKDDMFQAGCIGLIKAVDNFDISYNVTFSTYAVPMIIGEIKRIIRTNNSLRISRSIRDTAYQVLKTRAELEKKDVLATPKNIAQELNILESEVVYALDAISDPVSLYDPVYSKEGEELYLMDQISDVKESDDRWAENIALKSALEKLGEREKKILYLRYFEGRTQTEISIEVGLSQAQVSRLEKNALKVLHSKLENA
ncbi:MAG: sigma-70 family RNA polymerase sigma factor [Clostridiales bacterium]|nr:sigma-70 family RNA polymerase sigma factor [Clostridiales bacterium]